MFTALVEAGEELARDAGVRAVVLSGEGRGFCAGLDFDVVPGHGDGADGARREPGGLAIEGRMPGRITNHFQQAAYIWTELPVPVIAAVHGVALGGGMQIALAADLRIVAPDARLSVLEIRWGLIPDMTGTHMLRRLVGLDVAKELTWTGRMVDGTGSGAPGPGDQAQRRPSGRRPGPGRGAGRQEPGGDPGRQAAAEPVGAGQPGAAVHRRVP